MRRNSNITDFWDSNTIRSHLLPYNLVSFYMLVHFSHINSPIHTQSCTCVHTICMWIEGEENMVCCIQTPSNNLLRFSTQEWKLILFPKARAKEQVILRLSFLYAFIRSLILTLPIVRCYHRTIMFNALLLRWQQSETSVSQLHLPDLLNQKLWGGAQQHVLH